VQRFVGHRADSCWRLVQCKHGSDCIGDRNDGSDSDPSRQTKSSSPRSDSSSRTTLESCIPENTIYFLHTDARRFGLARTFHLSYACRSSKRPLHVTVALRELSTAGFTRGFLGPNGPQTYHAQRNLTQYDAERKYRSKKLRGRRIGADVLRTDTRSQDETSWKYRRSELLQSDV